MHSDAKTFDHEIHGAQQCSITQIFREIIFICSFFISDASILVSPPRAPLQVVTDANGANINTVAAPTGSSTSSSTAASPSSSNGTTPSTATSTSLRRSIFSQQLPHPQNNSPTVERLLKKISKKNAKGETPLHTAAIRGSARLVRQLLQMGADPNAQDNAEWSPLHEACNRGNLTVVKVLHEFGADLNLKGFGKDSPLHDAARNGHLKVVKFLIRSGANLKAKNAHGRTPREEAEVTLLKVNDNEDLDKTVSYLIELEEGAPSISVSDVSTDNESDDNDDTENTDLAKLLGLAKSPVVQEALQTLGLTPNQHQIAKKAAALASSDNTPTSGRSSSRFTGNGHNSTTKVRLTYGASDTKEKNVADDEDIYGSEVEGCSTIKKLKMSPPNETTSTGKKKVPPLKIVLQKPKVPNAVDSENEVSLTSSSNSSNNVTNSNNNIMVNDSEVVGSDSSSLLSLASQQPHHQQNEQPKLPPQQPFEVPFEYYMKKRKLRSPDVAVVLPQQRGQRKQSRKNDEIGATSQDGDKALNDEDMDVHLASDVSAGICVLFFPTIS